MQNRDAPAFQEYACSMMAKIEYRTMTLAERGLLYTMRLECWVNDGLPANPANPASLAKVLGYSEAEVKKALPAVIPFFVEIVGFFSSPELDRYKLHLADARKKMVEGGQKGGVKSAQKRAAKNAQKRTGKPP